MNPKAKTRARTIFILIVTLIVIFLAADYGCASHEFETATIVHKTFAPPGNYHSIKNPPPKYVIVAIQERRQQGYWIEIPKKEFYDFEPGDKIPLSKDYGFLTGWQYHQDIFLNPKDDLLPPKDRWGTKYSKQ